MHSWSFYFVNKEMIIMDKTRFEEDNVKAILEALDFIARDCEEYGDHSEAARYDVVAKKLVNGELKLVGVEK